MAEKPDHDEMERDLKGIGDRLRDMQDELRHREPLHDLTGMAEGDAVEMNPLTDPGAEDS